MHFETIIFVKLFTYCGYRVSTLLCVLFSSYDLFRVAYQVLAFFELYYFLVIYTNSCSHDKVLEKDGRKVEEFIC